MINKKTIIKVIIILILIIGNIFFGINYFITQKEIKQNQISLENQEMNNKVLEFTKFFIEKVLKTETEVDFETRLKLENLIRDLNNEEILIQWQKFIESKTEIDAQIEVKNLLEILISNIKVK